MWFIVLMCTCECTYAWSPEEDDAFSGDGAIESFVWLDVGSRTEPRLFARTIHTNSQWVNNSFS